MEVKGPRRNKLTSEANWDKRFRGFLDPLHTAALIALITGGVGSLGFMLYAGRRNNSRILPLLFTVWVLAPFIALLWANMVSKHWSDPTRAALYILMLVLALSSLAIYGYSALHPPKAQAAFAFVIVPPASWLLIAILGILSRRRG